MRSSLLDKSTAVVSEEVASESVKVVVFTIAGYRLGLPMDAILRVVNCPLELRDSSTAVELVHLKHQAITVLNLYSHLALKQINPHPNAGQFLVVTKVLQEVCAIRVDSPPDLMELLPSTIRKLPEPYRQGHPLNIASRVAILPQGKATVAIFLLDMRRVLDRVIATDK
ncbi:chemotaxis protein CheW [Phormidesmis sp. 146-12]